MKISSRTSFLALLLSLAPLSTGAHAQPDTNNGAKAENPVNRAPRGLRTPRAARPDDDATPEERMQWAIKLQFSRLGADEATQETLVKFIQSEMKAREELTEKGQPLQSALRAGVLSDTQIAALLNTYQVALEDEKARHAKAVAELGKTVNLLKSPKIEAALTLWGVIGEGPMVSMSRGMGRTLTGERGKTRRGRNEDETPKTKPAPAPAQGV